MRRAGTIWVFCTVLVIVVCRYFTETIAVLPRYFNAVEMVIVPVGISYFLGCRIFAGQRVRWPVSFTCICLFFLSCVLSVILNYHDILPPAALLYLTGYLLPILFAITIYNLKLGRVFARSLTRVVFSLGILEIAIALTQLNDIFGNPDAASATFGTNPNQTVLFLGIIICLLMGRWLNGNATVFDKLVLLTALPLFYLAGFKAMWVLFPTAVGTTIIFVSVRNWRHLLKGFVVVGLFFFAIACVLIYIPLPEMYHFESFGYYDIKQIGKYQALFDLPAILTERPWGVVFGVGPGTVYSRAFRTFADLPISGGRTDVTTSLVEHRYMTQMAETYLVPYLSRPAHFGSATIEYPFSSYLSLAAETGVAGFIGIILIYTSTWWQLVQQARDANAREARAAAFCGAATMLTLLLASTIDNYLEVTRVTLLAWTMVSVAWAFDDRDVARPLSRRASVMVRRGSYDKSYA